MPHYVDGFVLPVPKKNRAAYLKMARLGRKIWLEHGALDMIVDRRELRDRLATILSILMRRPAVALAAPAAGA